MNNIKCGLEIHQRLDTKKLFCECYADPNKISVEKEVQISRKLRPASGELGTTDIAAVFEAASEKTFEYTAGEKTSCLVERDEEPPHLVNREALQIALQVAKSLNAKIVNEVHVMRKTIIDGSAVSGFQRTALVAINGMIKVDSKNIGIQTISLEEESARIIERQDTKRASYGLDRLGIPLIEIATAPDIDSPELAKKTALEIGEILRNTGKVQRGIGTIRQDVNISIPEGERIEVKGCQEIDAMPHIIANEAKRQEKLLEIQDKLKQRAPRPSDKIVDLSPVFQNTASKIISSSLAGGGKVLGVKLNGFSGILCTEILPGFSFGRELEDRARIAGAKGTMHSDEDLQRFGITSEEKTTVMQLLNASSEDAFIMCCQSEATARKALEVIMQRCREAFIGVPKETRRVDEQITRFMRPLAGSSRMYPETDSPTYVITQDEVNNLENLETPQQKIDRYIGFGLNEELAKRMAGHQKFKLFERIAKNTRCNASTIAVTLLETFTALRREGVDVDGINEENIQELLGEYEEGTIAKPAISVVLKIAASNKEKSINKIIAENNLQRIEGDALRKLVIEHNGNIASLMKKFKANIEPTQLNQVIIELKASGKIKETENAQR